MPFKLSICTAAWKCKSVSSSMKTAMWLIKNVIGANCRNRPQKQGFMNMRSQMFLSERQRLHMLGKMSIMWCTDWERERDEREGTDKNGGKTEGRRKEEEAKTDRKINEIRNHRARCNGALQFKGLIPGGVEAALYGLGLLFTLAAGIWNQFKLHIGVWETIGVHGNQIPSLFD